MRIEEVKNIIIKRDFEEAQKIMNIGEYTKADVRSVYNERIDDSFNNRVFKVTIEREKDYERFTKMMMEEKKSYCEKRIDEANKIFRDYKDGLITKDEAKKIVEEIKNNTLKNKLLEFKVTFDEWKNGRLSNGQRLGKAMRKAGFSQELLDFYSQQIKTEKTIYLTITSEPQFIAGMSYYSTGNWDGMRGTSCQDPRHGGSYAKGLIGSLHDDKLYVGFLHESLSDLEDMKGKMLARVVFRLLEEFEDGESVLIATRYYGNNETKDLLHKALKLTETVAPIYSNDALGFDGYIEEANGYAVVSSIKDVHVYEDRIVYLEVDCPLCEGSGEVYGYDEYDYEYEVCCPHCEGDGVIEIEHSIYIDEFVQVESEEEEILPYAEEYWHNGGRIEIDIDKEYIRNKMKERKREGI